MSGATANGDAKGSPVVRTVEPPTEVYLAGVRSALADLPALEVTEILDDVRSHLADLVEELGADTGLAALTARLGTPTAYAAELRAAAGYPTAPRPDEATGHVVPRLAVAGLVGSTLLVGLGVLGGSPGVIMLGALVALLALPLITRDGPRVPSVAALPEVRRLGGALSGPGPARPVADFVASLQPAWWVLRALLASALLGWVFVGAVVGAVVGGGVGLGAVVLLALVAVPVSVWLGHRTRRDRRWLWVVVPLNAVAVALPLAGWLFQVSAPVSVSEGNSYPSQGGLWQDGRQILDIRPVDASGTPLTGVYLFDQDGTPIDTTPPDQYCHPGFTTPGVPVDPASPYPRGTVDYTGDWEGTCRLVPPGPLVVAVPSPTPSATAVPSATPGAGAPTPGPAPTPTPPAGAPPAGATEAPAGPPAAPSAEPGTPPTG